MVALIPDFAGALNNAVNYQSPSGSPGIKRNAMVFTSTLRTRADEQRVRSTNSFLTSEISVDAADFFTSRNARSFMPRIAMALNPNSVKFTQPKRFTKKNTRNGTVFFHFTNDQCQNNDVLTLSFKGNTGNIDRRGSLTSAGQSADPFAPTGTAVPVDGDTGALRRILVWHNLYLLTREPMYFSDGIENDFVITYMSALFPQAIDFHGFFNQVLDFEENAKKPNSRDYSFEFTVTSTDPPLENMLDEITTVLDRAVLQPSSTAQILGSNTEVVT